MSKQLTNAARDAVAGARNLTQDDEGGGTLGTSEGTPAMTEAEMSTMDAAFQKFRGKHFGPYEAYPVDAYTYFCSGWKARGALP